jgi:pimeloyl-ACP methyl ester carboxylesterase
MLEVWDDGRQLRLAQGRQRALLALLLLHQNEVVSIERLIEDFWGEHAPPSAPKVIQGYVSQLRRALPPEAIETHGSGYLLRVSDTLESLVVAHPLRERLRSLLMLALYRGDRQVEALDVYRATRSALVDTLGVEPSKALQQLEQRILAQDPALDLSDSDVIGPRSTDAVSSAPIDVRRFLRPQVRKRFPGEIWRTPRSWVEKSYPNVIYFNEVDKGGHFAAWEEPDLFSEEVRAAFRPLRSST